MGLLFVRYLTDDQSSRVVASTVAGSNDRQEAGQRSSRIQSPAASGVPTVRRGPRRHVRTADHNGAVLPMRTLRSRVERAETAHPRLTVHSGETLFKCEHAAGYAYGYPAIGLPPPF